MTKTKDLQDQDQDRDSRHQDWDSRPQDQDQRLSKFSIETSRDQDSSLENSKSALLLLYWLLQVHFPRGHAFGDTNQHLETTDGSGMEDNNDEDLFFSRQRNKIQETRYLIVELSRTMFTLDIPQQPVLLSGHSWMSYFLQMNFTSPYSRKTLHDNAFYRQAVRMAPVTLNVVRLNRLNRRRCSTLITRFNIRNNWIQRLCYRPSKIGLICCRRVANDVIGSTNWK